MAQNCRFAFAVHVLAVLARHPGEPCSSIRLARTVNTNPVIIRRLLMELTRCGFVRTERGPHGGALLRLAPESIRMGKVFHAVEGDGLFGAHPRRPMASCPVGRRIETVLEDVNRRAQAAVEKELNSISLADVVASCQG